MAERLMETASEISTHFRCDHCGITIDDVAWRQCKICKIFDLCHTCGKMKYNQLLASVRNDHMQRHTELGELESITDDCIEKIAVEQAEANSQTIRNKIREEHLNRIQKEKKISNDYDMSIVMDELEKLKKTSSLSSKDIEWHGLDSLLARYHLEAHERNIRILSLDGGGVRGYMPIKIVSELIAQKYLSLNEPFDPHNAEHKEAFQKIQGKFTEQFDYFVGTSTGGLIAFCLAMNYSVLKMMDIYADYSYYFWRNYLGPIIYSKYNPARIHQKIDDIINSLSFKNGTKLSAENATLLDIRNILNQDDVITNDQVQLRASNHGNLLEFVDDTNNIDSANRVTNDYSFHRIYREKVLLITSYNTTTNSITIFNTSYAPHWNYRIADVLKATMAAPTYFPPMEIFTGKKVDGVFRKDAQSELFIDGGVFANDPELSALWAIRMQWKKPANYHLLSIGTGCYKTALSSSTWGGYLGWIMNKGYLVNTLMDAPRSFIEIIGSNLAKFSNIRRMKLNYNMKRSMALDDGEFVRVFDKEWEQLKTEEDYKAFVYFYDSYIVKRI
ncbi:unnamed protein product [Adineta ricciae]|uniref:PNPLA domain-containing protein n=3 Tax=Adineta ricciae TaxID=249248 RepID=A0A815NHJ3_ADIRI|nr:unnamed protein product [Adineta ricciae]